MKLSSLFNTDPKPFDEAYLPEQDGHRVYFHRYGNPNGKTILCFHGGPGGSSRPDQAKLFNLKTHHVILFDQRGCGKSLPRGATQNNTTHDILNDAKHIINHLNISSLSLYGASWGATLALLFAQQNPKMIENLIVGKIFLARQKDIEWVGHDSAMFYPDIMETLRKTIPPNETPRSFYAKKMASNHEDERVAATSTYGNYELIIGALDPKLPLEYPAQDHIQSFGVYMHYDQCDYGVGDNRILDNITTIAHIPTLILHNRLDMVCPIEQAWTLHRAIPKSKIVIVPDYGHSSPLLRKTTQKEARKFLAA